MDESPKNVSGTLHNGRFLVAQSRMALGPID